jgi:hypothetical protein
MQGQWTSTREDVLSATSALSGFDFLVFPPRLCVSVVKINSVLSPTSVSSKAAPNDSALNHQEGHFSAFSVPLCLCGEPASSFSRPAIPPMQGQWTSTREDVLSATSVSSKCFSSPPRLRASAVKKISFSVPLCLRGEPAVHVLPCPSEPYVPNARKSSTHERFRDRPHPRPPRS